jgi:lipopolysaccharide/colanic/teichoic acid biosynthesis glycosyltransferase
MVLANSGQSTAVGPDADRPDQEGHLMSTGGLPDDPQELCRHCRNMVLEDSEVSDDVLTLLEECENITERAALCHEMRGLLCPLDSAAETCDNGSRGWLYNAIKRGMDVVGGLIGSTMVVLSLPLIAAIVKIQSPGKIFFSQDRVGLNGETFRLYKFRTMHRKRGNEARWASEEEHRIFGFGAFMRRFHIDEFPQFFNVLRGEMSLVGPRPEQVPIVERLGEKIPNYNQRHCVLPGLTGWSQMRHGYAGSELTSWLKTASDLYYVKHRSTRFDFAIMLKTIPAVLIKEQFANNDGSVAEEEDGEIPPPGTPERSL